MTIKKSIVVLATVGSLLIVSCETEEDPGGDGGLGYMGDTDVSTTVDGRSGGGEGGY